LLLKAEDLPLGNGIADLQTVHDLTE